MLLACSEHAWRRDARKLLQAQEGLNRSQQEAIARAITRSITLWQVCCRQQAPYGWQSDLQALRSIANIWIRVNNPTDVAGPKYKASACQVAEPVLLCLARRCWAGVKQQVWCNHILW